MADSQDLVFWAKHSQQWRSSGLTQKAYCAREKLSHPTFHRRHRQILANQKAKQASSPKITFATVSVMPDDTVSTATLSLYSPSGWRIDLPAQISPSLLGPLLAVLP